MQLADKASISSDDDELKIDLYCIIDNKSMEHTAQGTELLNGKTCNCWDFRYTNPSLPNQSTPYANREDVEYLRIVAPEGVSRKEAIGKYEESGLQLFRPKPFSYTVAIIRDDGLCTVVSGEMYVRSDQETTAMYVSHPDLNCVSHTNVRIPKSKDIESRPMMERSPGFEFFMNQSIPSTEFLLAMAYSGMVTDRARAQAQA